MSRQLPIRASDGHRWRIELFEPARPRAALLFAAAMGVEASYYQRLAEMLAERGLAVALSDLRGNGYSSLRASREVDFGYRELCELDLPAAVDALEDAVPGLPIVVGGHSLGGQASALYAALHPKRVDAVLLIAACLVDYRLFAGRLRPGLRIAGHLFPAVARLLGSFPGHRFRFGGREARTLMAEWGRVARTGDYRAHGSERDYETALRRAEHELLAVSFSDDSWAPKSAVDGLVNKMPRARARHIHLGRADLGRVTDHFRWARSPEVVAEVVEDWLSDRLEKRDTEVANPR